MQTELEIDVAKDEMNQAAMAVAEALMRGIDTAPYLAEFKAKRERYLFGADDE